MQRNCASLECVAVQYIGCYAQDAPDNMPKTSNKEPGSTERIIKKYPNRRLYDTNTSTYITLADVRELVMSRSAFVVRDAKTNEDLTRAILLQIIWTGLAASTYAVLFAVAFSLVLKVVKVWNFAQAGIMALSGYLPLADRFAAERHAANASTPVFMAHGTQDPVVLPVRGEATRQLLTSLGYAVQWHSYPMGHSVHPQEVADVSAFLQRVLGPGSRAT